jgi:hypothetical protein
LYDYHNKIELQYIDTQGCKQKKKYDLGTEVISLYSLDIEQINLSPLRKMKNLQHLRLEMNKVRSINLAPLRRCKSLRLVWLWSNKLDAIDLSPLKHCTIHRTLDYLISQSIMTVEYTTGNI